MIDDIWLDMLTDRNNLVHDYDGSMAKETFSSITGNYTEAFEKFESSVHSVIDGIGRE